MNPQGEYQGKSEPNVEIWLILCNIAVLLTQDIENCV